MLLIRTKSRGTRACQFQCLFSLGVHFRLHQPLGTTCTTFLELMDSATKRGIDVRVLVWHPEGHGVGVDDVFPGDRTSAELLAKRGTAWNVRWDAVGRNCQHQKVWLVDAGTPAAVAFVGGLAGGGLGVCLQQ